MNKGSSVFLAAGIVLAGILSASAQTAEESGWNCKITPYFWAIATKGDVGVGNVSAPVDMSFSEAWDRLEFGGMLAFEANKDEWIVFLDGTFINIDDNKNTQLGKFRVELEQSILQSAIGYKLIEEPKLSLDVGLGGRYIYSDVDINVPTDRADISQSKDWADPIIIARVITHFTDNCYGVLAGDIGGFGVSSDLTAQICALAGYTLNETISLLLGYRYLYYDYEDGDFSYDITTSGFVAGLQFDL